MKDKLTIKLEEAWSTVQRNLSISESMSTNSLIIPPKATTETPLSDEKMDEEETAQDPNKPTLMGNHTDCGICSFYEDSWDDESDDNEEEFTTEGNTQTDLEPDKPGAFNRDAYKTALAAYKGGKEAGDELVAKVKGNNDEDEAMFTPPKHGIATYGDMAGDRDVPDRVIKKTGINIADNPDAYLDELKNLMLMEPTPEELFGQNGKLAKSGDDKTIFYDFTLPAYKGVYYSKKFDDFQMLTVCPSAKECKQWCYASKGNFTQYPRNNLPRSRTLTFLINNPEKFVEAMISQIEKVSATQKKKGKKLFFRWHDSGDFFSETYARMAFLIAKNTPNVLHYAYTKQVNMMKSLQKEIPTNFTFNYSYGGKDDSMIDRTQDKYSFVIKPESDLKFNLGGFKKAWKFLMDKQTKQKKAKNILKKLKSQAKKASPEEKDAKDFAIELALKNYNDISQEVDAALHMVDRECMNETFRTAVGEKLGVPPETVVTYFEMVDIPEDPNRSPKLNVLVYPGCGDVSAARKDVSGTLLLIH